MQPKMDPESLGFAELDARFLRTFYFANTLHDVDQVRMETDYAQLNIVLAGTYHVSLDGEQHTATVGNVVYSPSDMVRWEHNDPGVRLRIMSVLFQWPTPLKLPYMLTDQQGRIRRIAEWMHAERTNLSWTGHGVLDAWLRAMLAEYVRLASSEPLHDLVVRVRAYVTKRIREPLTLDDLAGHVNLEKHHFVRRYRQLSGATPMADVRQIRLEVARQLLEDPMHSVADVVALTGFSNPVYFSRLFKKQFGLSPSQWRSGRR